MRIKLGWPVTLREPSLLVNPVVLRPYRSQIASLAQNPCSNAQWLRRWEMTVPDTPRYPANLNRICHGSRDTRDGCWDTRCPGPSLSAMNLSDRCRWEA